MGLGVLEPSSAGPVPGTVILSDEAPLAPNGTNNLKRGSGKHTEIILTPQPTDDPNDPLNWPYYQKVLIVAIIVYGACLCACCTGPLLNASYYVLTIELQRSFADLALLTGYQILVAGATGPIVSAISTKYGKRAVFLLSALACLVGTIIGSCSQTYNTLLAGRIVQGLSLACWESLPFTIVADLFFVHERGLWITVMSFTLTAVSNLSSVIAGQIVSAYDWHYLFHILNGCLGILIILVFLFVPETCYHRDPGLTNNEFAGPPDHEKERTAEAIQIEDTEVINQVPKKKTFWQRLAIFTGTHSDESLIRLFLAPFLVCANLGALWTIIITGAVSSFYVAIAYVTAQLFGPPPYLLSPAGIGNLSLGPFIGGALGSILVGILMDPLILRLAKRNNGIYEPEFRLPLSVIGLLCGVGLFGFGYLTKSQGNLYAIDFMWGLCLVGIAFIGGPCSAYAIDAFPGMSNEIFIANIMFKNFLFYGYSYFVNNWVESAGPAIPFYTFGGISFFLVATTLGVYVFGKRYRSFWHRHNFVKGIDISTPH
ncbi:major facilitator superfamily domain-containing protein [Ilyonectria sp. MPI-CAGE-AT-0026]|nr:major facilitator superfamily domain-containing protein [Ilyonectria sp. MPI-CAGE-AT-0026]